MSKILYCVVLFIVGVNSLHSDEDDLSPDYWRSDYDDLYDYDFLKENKELGDLLKIEKDVSDNDKDVDKKVEEEIKQLRQENENSAKEEFDAMDDYQIEDNKQISQEDVKESADSDGFEEKPEVIDKSNENADEGSEILESTETKNKENNTAGSSVSKEFDANEDYALLWGDGETTAPLPVPIVEDDKKIFQETQEILNEEEKDDNSFDDEVHNDVSLLIEQQSNLEEIIDETKKILADNENDFKDVTSKGKINQIESGDISYEELLEDDSVDKNIEKDLDESLQELIDTMKKLGEDQLENASDEKIQDGDLSNISDYEKKNGKPYNEELVLSQRQDQDEDYELVNDSNLSEIFSKVAKSSNEALEDNSQEIENYDSVNVYSNEEELKTSTEKNTEDTTTSKPIMYENDALVDDGQRIGSEEVEEFDVENSGEINSEVEKTESNTEEKLIDASTDKLKVRKKMVDDLTSRELDDLMEQFTIFHSEDLDIHSSDFAKNVAPIHIKLSVDEPVVITSPNYPNPYPTNNILDWIFEGEGMGIELNVTDFAVNGALGDYVLFKPGGIDETGHGGLVFSYRLTSERRFRFTDVNRMFVRFQANLGMMFLRGFQFSVKLISPLPQEVEDLPESEAVLSPPGEILTLHLGGVSLDQFLDMKEQFRELIADMATQYIREYKVDPGMNYTIEVTQITNVGLCNVNWPDHESCVKVTFGIPLTYEEGLDYRFNAEDLDTMWREYSKRDPFALRLRQMGITEFAMPDDSSVMMVWLVIASGVVISMAMLAFALWRFSCFEDYTRMQAYSDTDSIKDEKRGLDLYPTPHQILPPLYAENDYKWADDSTRVDMGGFSNKNYVRDDLYDFDSEEEVVPTRDRFTSDV